MRVSLNAKYDAQIRSLSDHLGIAESEVVNLILSRFLSTFQQWVNEPTPVTLTSVKAVEPTTTKPEYGQPNSNPGKLWFLRIST